MPSPLVLALLLALLLAPPAHAEDVTLSVHAGSCRTHVASGLNAAIAAEKLRQLDTQLVADPSQVRDVALAPSTVMPVEVERVAGTRGCASLATPGAARLVATRLQPPAGDDQLRLAGIAAPAANPPIDPAANGLRSSSGVTAFAACETTASGANARCP